jgi:Ca-activated chloride channel family protein
MLCAFPVKAFNVLDLFETRDQQAMHLMEKGAYTEAEQTFQRPDWQAASAYRAGDYPVAAQLYPTLKNAEGPYNQGNALAHMGQYEEAIKAYDKALAINPHEKDALHNRKIIEDLLKKQKEKQQNQPDQQKQDQQQNQQQDQQNQSESSDKNQKNDQSKPDQSKQNQNSSDPNQQEKNQQNQNQQNQGQSNQESKNQEKNPSTPDKSPPPGTSNTDASSTNTDLENQQARNQLMQIIPDDPGGLLKEKFHRDFLRRQQGLEP